MKPSTGQYWLALPTLLLTIAAPQLAAAKDTAPSPNMIAGTTIPWVAGVGSANTGYRSKTFKLSTGSIRLLEFKKSDGTARYKLTSEKEFYVVSGTVEIDAKDKKQTVVAGDAVNLPAGTLTGRSNGAEDTSVILFTVPNGSKTPVGGIVPSQNAKLVSPPPGPPKNGVPGAAISIKTYPFDGNSIRVIRMNAPGHTPVTAHEQDSILYLLSGKMRLTLGSNSKVIKAGDAVREPAGVPSYWDVLEDSTFVSTSAPIPPNDAP
jgi:quercetin dioxygenase-like cupin family protein